MKYQQDLDIVKERFWSNVACLAIILISTFDLFDPQTISLKGR